MHNKPAVSLFYVANLPHKAYIEITMDAFKPE